MSKIFVELLSYCEPALCLLALIALLRAREHRSFATLTALLSVRLLGGLLCLMLLEVGARHILSVRAAYNVYFYTYWISFAVESLLSLYVILSIFRLAMAPLKGLRALGMLVFRWAAGISIAARCGHRLLAPCICRFASRWDPVSAAADHGSHHTVPAAVCLLRHQAAWPYLP